MSEEELNNIAPNRSAAMQEFLKKGFKSASLRNIVKIAGVTTGAFYGYYDSKEDLFESLVSEHYNFFIELLLQGTERICRNPARGTA